MARRHRRIVVFAPDVPEPLAYEREMRGTWRLANAEGITGHRYGRLQAWVERQGRSWRCCVHAPIAGGTHADHTLHTTRAGAMRALPQFMKAVLGVAFN